MEKEDKPNSKQDPRRKQRFPGRKVNAILSLNHTLGPLPAVHASRACTTLVQLTKRLMLSSLTNSSSEAEDTGYEQGTTSKESERL